MLQIIRQGGGKSVYQNKGGLSLVADFLNYEFNEKKGGQHPFKNRWQVAFDNRRLSTLQNELKDKLLAITVYGQDGKGHTQKLEGHLQELVDAINKLDIKTRYGVVRGSSSSWTPTLKFLNSRFYLMRLRLADVDQADLELYDIILDSLLAGTLTRLRRCKKCDKFFIGKKAGADYCGDACRVNFHNTAERIRTYRKQRREKDIKRAKELRQKGWGIYRISEDTGLSDRVLRKSEIA